MSRSTLAGAFRVRLVAAMIAVYTLFVLAVTLYPHTVDRGLEPYLERVLERLHAHGVPAIVDYGSVEFTANVVFFLPVGFLLALLLPRRLQWLAVLGGLLLSSAVETAQGLFLPGRVSSLGDVVANTTGTLLGCAVAAAVRAVVLHRDGLVIRDVLAGRRGPVERPVAVEGEPEPERLP